MKRMTILAFLVCALLCSMAAQSTPVRPRMGKYNLAAHRAHAAMASRQMSPTVLKDLKVWDLGTAGGSWSWANDVNDFGVVVGWTSMPETDFQHPGMIPLFGPNAMQWADLGTLGGEAPPGIAAEAFGASDTGIIVGHAFNAAGNDRAFVWTSWTGITDLGTLPGHTDSEALDVNRIGTLIVGYSAGHDATLPVVWTPSIQWTNGKLVVTWKIHQIAGLDLFPNGLATAVNNFGQIAGGAWNDTADTTVLWNPAGKQWKPKQLHGTADYPNPWPAELNDRGEVVGMIYAPDWVLGCAALWQPSGPRKTYKLTTLANPWGMCNGDGGIGINDQGDIVGVVYDDSFNGHAAYWTTRNPSTVQLMPLTDRVWSYSANVNEWGIAAAAFGGGDFMHAAAVALH